MSNEVGKPLLLSAFGLGMLFMFLLQLILVDLGIIMIPITVGIAIGATLAGMILEYIGWNR